MGLVEAKNLLNNQADLATCASLSMATLSPRSLTQEEIEACVYNGGDIQRLESILRKHLVETGNVPYSIQLKVGYKPSVLLRDINKYLKTNKNFKFLGGFLMTKDIVETNNSFELHVIGVISLHSNDSATILDTMSNMRGKAMHRVQPLSSLDRRAMKENELLTSSQVGGSFFIGHKENLFDRAHQSGYYVASKIHEAIELIQKASSLAVNLGQVEKEKEEELNIIEKHGHYPSKRKSKLNKKFKATG